MESHQEIRLTLSVAEVNLILEALGNGPYIQVYKLINKIQRQGESQMSNGSNGSQLSAHQFNSQPATELNSASLVDAH